MAERLSEEGLVLHTVRVLGFADAARVAARLGLSGTTVDDHLLDAQAFGWVSRSAFSDVAGWSVTEAGKAVAERLVAAELDASGARDEIAEAYSAGFLPLNHDVAVACSAWQLTELGIGDEPKTLAQIVDALSGPADALAVLESLLAVHLPRLAGYHGRFAAALRLAPDDPSWINGTDRDSCHRTWFELHEDLIGTLGLAR